jgi:hypothetical protein
MAFEEVIGEAETHILRIPAAVGAIHEHVALRYRDRKIFVNIEINAVADFGHHTLLCGKKITSA